MAKASFFVNDIKIRKKGDFLVLEARKVCQHGTVFDEVFLTLPGKLGTFFTQIEGNPNSIFSQNPAGNLETLTERFKRFSSDN